VVQTTLKKEKKKQKGRKKYVVVTPLCHLSNLYIAQRHVRAPGQSIEQTWAKFKKTGEEGGDKGKKSYRPCTPGLNACPPSPGCESETALECTKTDLSKGVVATGRKEDLSSGS